MGVFVAVGCANGVAPTSDGVVFEQTSTESPDSESVRVPEKTTNKAALPDEVDAEAHQPADAGSDASPAMDASVNEVCSTAQTGLGGIGVPPASSVTANRSYQSLPAQATDGDRDTFWNGGGFSASLEIQLPKPQALTGVRIAAGATPASSETYRIYGYKGAQGTLIGTLTAHVAVGYTILPAINVISDTYDKIRIDVIAADSWVLVYDVSILTAACP